jgi:hypothetical protein
MEENKKLILELNTFRKRIEVKEREGDLLRRQIRSLEEDNERKNKMYDMMNHSMSETKKKEELNLEEADYSFAKHDQARAEEHRAQLEKKGWKTAVPTGASFGQRETISNWNNNTHSPVKEQSPPMKEVPLSK